MEKFTKILLWVLGPALTVKFVNWALKHLPRKQNDVR